MQFTCGSDFYQSEKPKGKENSKMQSQKYKDAANYVI